MYVCIILDKNIFPRYANVYCCNKKWDRQIYSQLILLEIPPYRQVFCFIITICILIKFVYTYIMRNVCVHAYMYIYIYIYIYIYVCVCIYICIM